MFGTPLYAYSNPGSANDGMTFWNGNLSVPASWNGECPPGPTYLTYFQYSFFIA